MSFLAIDIGNSNVTFGLYSEGEWRTQWRTSSREPRSSGDWRSFLMKSPGLSIHAGEIDSCGIASVVPNLTAPLEEALRAMLACHVTVIESHHFRALPVTYEPRSAVGVDRLCGVVAGLRKYGAPLIVVDLGTATVFDVVDEGGAYRGGVIAPGVATAADSLYLNTALLPQISLSFPLKIVGTSTTHAMQSGILFGAIAMIDGLVDSIGIETGLKSKVIATGGFASLLKERSKTIDFVEPDLVLDGIRLTVEGEA